MLRKSINVALSKCTHFFAYHRINSTLFIYWVLSFQVQPHPRFFTPTKFNSSLNQIFFRKGDIEKKNGTDTPRIR